MSVHQGGYPDTGPLDFETSALVKDVKSILSRNWPKLSDVPATPMVKVLEYVDDKTEIRVKEKLVYVTSEVAAPPPAPAPTHIYEADDFLNGVMYLTGYGREQCYFEAKKYFDAARAHYLNLQKSRGHGRRSDNDGHEEINTYNNATNCLGKMYLNGEGVVVNNESAFKYFEESSANGSPEGYYWKGYMYEYDLVPNSCGGLAGRNKMEMVKGCYEQAAKCGNADAMVDLAYLYEQEMLPSENPMNEAIKLLGQARG